MELMRAIIGNLIWGFSIVVVAELGVIVVVVLAIGVDLLVEYLNQGAIATLIRSKGKKKKKILNESR